MLGWNLCLLYKNRAGAAKDPASTQEPVVQERPVYISGGQAMLEGDLAIPTSARGIVLCAHGSGSSRYSPRNRLEANPSRPVAIAREPIHPKRTGAVM